MGVYKRGDNWYIDYRVKGKRVRKKIGPSKRLAETALKDTVVKVAKGEFLGIYEEKKILFRDFAKEYLEYSKSNKSRNTFRSNTISVNKHFASLFDYYITDITPSMIEKFKSMRLEEVKPATVNRDIACLKHMFTIANRWGYTKHNPTRGIKLFKEPPGRVRYLDNEEVDRLISECSWPLRSIVVIALNTGMRKGEILSIKWSDIDFKNRILQVRETKNNERRIVTINNTLYQELSSIPRHINSLYVFYNKDGKPFKDVRKSFATALKRAKISDFRFHDLRHTFASHLAMSGVSLKTIQQLLGHKDFSMTMRYAHLSEEYMQNAVQKLDTIWSQTGKRSQAETRNPLKSLEPEGGVEPPT